MPAINRRRFIGSSSVLATACAADLGFLAPLGHAAATETRINPNEVVFSAETDRLLRLLRSTSREECVPAFVKEIANGLSYQQFLTVLFLGAVENGDPHQVAQVYGAHRVGSEVRVEERLLPLFWVLHRIKQEMEPGAKPHPAARPFKGQLPAAGKAEGLFREAMLKSDKAEAERAVLALARDHGARHTMHRLLEFAPRNVGGTLGHPAIALANGWRAMEAMGWQHAEVVLRYATDIIGGFEGDGTYVANLERVKKSLAELPEGWAGTQSDKSVTLELYKVLRAGKPDEAGEMICTELRAGKAKAGSVWDAIRLACADTLFRYKTGGQFIGSVQIHAVTTTNALHHGFALAGSAETKLIALLQAAGVTADHFVRQKIKRGELRDMNLLDLAQQTGKAEGTMRDVFEMLPFKNFLYQEKDAGERAASDQACRRAFGLLAGEDEQAAFMRTARGFLCVKASMDAHDIKYPAAIFEDARLASPEWRPYLLASSVHALHGSKSKDTAALVQVKDALRKTG